MKRRASTIYAVACTLLMVAGLAVAFYFAYCAGIADTVQCLCGIVTSLIIAPIVHEVGHVAMAKRSNMRIVYTKCFCFAWKQRDGKLRFSFVSPFRPEQTSAIPNSGGNMKKRAQRYVLGGLITGGAFALVCGALALIVTLVYRADYFLFGVLPYTVYLVILNAVPCNYAGGKTDALVFAEIKKGGDVGRNLLSAMEIQGQLSEGKSFSEIPESLYFDLPVLCEDEPLFAVMLDLRYRYYLEKGELELAGQTLNRMAYLQPYLSFEESQKVAVELVYMHALCGDIKSAEQNAQVCAELLKQPLPPSKRALAVCAKAVGKIEEAKALVAQAREIIPLERVAGVRKFEEILLARVDGE